MGENSVIVKKGGRMLLYDRAQNRLTLIDKQMSSIKRELRRLPAGRIECVKYENGYRWYEVKNKERRYMRKGTEHDLAQKLAHKRKLNDEFDRLKCEKAAIDVYLKLMRAGGCVAQETQDCDELISVANKKGKRVKVKDIVSPNGKINVANVEIDRLNKEFVTAAHPELFEWASAEYPHRSDEDDAHNVKANSGRWHESKDEVLIDNALLAHGLQVRYEPELKLGTEIVYPDFQIMNPKTGKTIYWEHFGMMDSPTYLKRNLPKLNNYIWNGYYPGVNFIATFMGGDYRFDSQLIETIIEYFFE